MRGDAALVLPADGPLAATGCETKNGPGSWNFTRTAMRSPYDSTGP
jgi:hypothetical protein